MRRILSLLAFSALFSTLALAESWSGMLLDATCFDEKQQELKDITKAATACAATSQTSTFALAASGKVYKFDSAGNTKAMTALKSRADRSEPGKSAGSAVNAKVEGTESSGAITVESIEVQ